MIRVRFNPHVLSSQGQKHKDVPFVKGKDVRYYLTESGFQTKGMRVVLSGKACSDWDDTVLKEDEITIVPGINFIIPAGASLWTIVWMTVANIAIAIAVNYAVSALLARKPSRNTTGNSIDDGSSTYGWDGIRTTQEVGTPVPVIYGEHMVGGNVINQFLSLDGDKHYLNTLLSISEGEIESVDAVYINNNPKENYSGITFQSAVGTNDQAPLANFDLLHNLYNVNVNLTKNNPHTYTMIGNGVQGFDLYFQLPQGIYKANDDGSVSAWDVTYTVEYKLHTDSSWTSLGSTTISYKSRTVINRIFSKRGLTAGQYDVRVTKTSDDPSISSPVTVGDINWGSIDEIVNQDLAYPNTALVGVQALATDQLNGATPNFGIVVKGKKILIPDVRYSGNSVVWADYYHDGTNYKRFSDDAVCTWDGTTFITAWSANPVWCVYDLLLSSRYGLGDFIDTSMISLPSFITMSQYCENKVADGNGGWEKRMRLDIVLDSSTKALDMLVQMAQSFRAILFYSSGTIKVKIDKADVPVQMFGMGNIIEGSFQQSWTSIKSRYNVVEAQYLDKDKLYAQEKIAVQDDVALADGDPMRKLDIRLFCTSASQAYREARYYLWMNKYVKRSVSFKAGIDAICCEAGDIININHDIPAWGYSGRVLRGATTTVVPLDRTITIESGKTYKIVVRHSDDTLEERTILTPPGDVTSIEVTSPFNVVPDYYSPYALGESTIQTKPFKILDIKVNNDHTAEINALEYNESIYDDSAPALPTPNYSALSGVIPNVSNLKLTERLVKLSDGTIGDCIDVWWTNPSSIGFYVMFSKVRIYISDNAGTSWSVMGETAGDSFSILSNLIDKTTYRVAVASIGADGKVNPVGLAPYADITLIGKSAPPNDVTGFLLNQNRDQLIFTWNPNSDLDLSGYEIRKGLSWESGNILATQLRSTNYVENRISLGDSQSYWIKAIDTSGNYSTNPAEAIISVDSVPFQNIVESFAEETAWTGTKTDCSKVGDNIELDSGKLTGTYITPVRDVGYVAPFSIQANTVVLDASSDMTIGDFGEKTIGDLAPDQRIGGAEIIGATSLEIRISLDNVTWGDWIPWQGGDFYCRYFQFRLTLSRSDVGNSIHLTTFDYYADLPDVNDYGLASVTDASAGQAVTFAKTYHQIPAVHVSIIAGSGYIPVFSVAPTLSGFTVKLYDLSGTAVTGDFAWFSHGI